jgi:MurNAc alpha-1-phosphate uridylyltransferase
MKAMILAAGRGERMMPLTETTPKPLLTVGGKPLIVYHLEALSKVGITEVVINIAYLGQQIREYLGDGSLWDLAISYSEEPEPLETAGALLQAMPLLGDSPFLLINGDVWTDFSFKRLMDYPLGKQLGCLVLVANPAHNPEGDFCLTHSMKVSHKVLASEYYTFSGIGIFSPDMIKTYPGKRQIFPLREVFTHTIEQQALSGIVYSGQWWDIGTPERLSYLDKLLCKRIV